jgi:pimeloyl-ACP methyl ester carboxylesterase/quercetin dioxygenase-like cupin family protein
MNISTSPKALAASNELTHGFADLGDVRLHYVTGGQGPTVVLLHGWPQTWFMWRDILPGLMPHYCVVAPDLRGLGDSSRPDGGYDMKTVAQDIWRLVRDVLGVKEFFVVGHDWGGPVAYALAAQHRDAVLGMAIFDAPVPGDGSIITNMPRWHFGFHRETGLAEALVEGREDLYLGYLYRKAEARTDAVSEEAQREYLRTYRQPGAMRAGFNYYRELEQSIRDNQAFIKQGKLTMPILCYGGGDPRVGRGLFVMDSWQRVATDVRGGIAEGCGHWIPEERPDWVVDRLLEFFSGINRTGVKPASERRQATIKGESMFFESVDTSLVHTDKMPWMPFVPYANDVFIKVLKVDPIRGETITMLKSRASAKLPKHHHSGTVQVYTISGAWRYLEHDWVATPGSFVYETAGSQHTPVGVGEDDVVTLNIVQGDWNLMSPDGQILAIENWKTQIERYLNYCKANGIQPQDVSAFGN